MKFLLKGLCLSVVLIPSLLAEQNPEAISQFFEGKTVTVKIDMPGTQKGVDIYTNKTQSLDTKSYSKRLREFGTSLRNGDTVVISKIKVKSDSIEFQLGGGGFGVTGDNTDETVHFTPAGKSDHEKELENQLNREADPDRRRSLSGELDDLRRSRERQDQRNRAAAEVNADERKQQISSNRRNGGSRFNIHLNKRSEDNVLTPQFVMTSLAQYVYFPAATFGPNASQPAESANNAAGSVPVPAAQTVELRKGLTRAQVEAMFGPPTETHDETQSSLTKTTCTYQNAKQVIKAEFVNDVLVQYSISSR